MLSEEEGGGCRKSSLRMSRCLGSWCVEVEEEGHRNSGQGKESCCPHYVDKNFDGHRSMSLEVCHTPDVAGEDDLMPDEESIVHSKEYQLGSNLLSRPLR